MSTETLVGLIAFAFFGAIGAALFFGGAEFGKYQHNIQMRHAMTYHAQTTETLCGYIQAITEGNDTIAADTATSNTSKWRNYHD